MGATKGKHDHPNPPPTDRHPLEPLRVCDDGSVLEVNQLAYLELLKAVTASVIPDSVTDRDGIEDWLVEAYRPPSTDAANWSVLSQQTDRLFREWVAR